MKITRKLTLAFGFLLMSGMAWAKSQIVIETAKTGLVFTVGDDGRLYQSYFGEKLLNEAREQREKAQQMRLDRIRRQRQMEAENARRMQEAEAERQRQEELRRRMEDN